MLYGLPGCAGVGLRSPGKYCAFSPTDAHGCQHRDWFALGSLAE